MFWRIDLCTLLLVSSVNAYLLKVVINLFIINANEEILS